MARLNLDKVWVNLVSTGESVSAKSAERSEAVGRTGDVRIYASGRKRAFSQVGQTREFTVTLKVVSNSDCRLLESWQGQTLLIRDFTGRKTYGTFFNLNYSDHRIVNPGYQDVTIIFKEISYQEGAS